MLRPRDEPVRRKPTITLIEYDRANLEERTIENREELLEHLDNQRVTWINIDGLGDIEVTGDASLLQKLLAVVEKPDPSFAIVTP